jgi:nucleoside-diphosphate-sugar epimerase
MNKIFITGASGFIGKHVLKELTVNHECIALTRDNEKINNLLNGNLTIANGNLTDINSYKEYLNGCTHLVHIAGEKRDENKMYEVNVKGTENLITAAITANVKNIIHLSSGGVYGIRNHPETIITENSNCYPSNNYEITKLASEKVIQAECEKNGMRYSILRLTNVIGEFENKNKLLNLIKAIRSGKFFIIDKHAMVNYVYVKSIVMVISELLTQKPGTSETYNINAPMNIIDFINEIRQELHLQKATKSFPRILALPAAYLFELLPESLRVFDKGRYLELTNKKIYSIDKIKNALKIDHVEVLKKGLHHLVAHYKERGLI